MSMNDWLFPRGSLAVDRWESVVDSGLPGWAHTGLRIAEFDGEIALPSSPVERMIVPLHGSFAVAASDDRWVLRGRRSVFDGPTDVLYVGAMTGPRIEGAGRLAIAESPTRTLLPPALLHRDGVPVEIRGAGRSTRQVHNFGVPGALAADRLIVCEVITPAENWSSYPPHKHDRAGETESELEEIYYFEAAVTRGAEPPADARPFGLFTAYPSDEREIDIAARVGTGDIALVPHGYHGPAVAAPGYDLYYLNVMAGPGSERAWRITDDPTQAWIRRHWSEQHPDPRLPYTAKEHAS
ncbi:5-deoxy-glucuronate isomerase [Microbacterium hydrocarbonoxydans]|uniref:5-deoxy-glucuronate isomerase n=1 Tax=Microbacterium hydrocarbonoxydans TaxID=273678 RepID=UPI00203FC80A|nr:5-deoxy-glucuronate isomerase [Microbacterium hydrocarbonoxydans]MCM3778351.1 5-deoxy-glucuronate isomerase [Microbacterium hydrocarbonoxydans]